MYQKLLMKTLSKRKSNIPWVKVLYAKTIKVFAFIHFSTKELAKRNKTILLN